MTDKITERIIAAAIEVHRTLAPGLPESINATALCHEFDLQAIRYETQKSVDVNFRDLIIMSMALNEPLDNRQLFNSVPSVAKVFI